LSTTEETWLVEMRIWCIKIGIVLVLHTCILNYDLYRRNIVNSPLRSCGMREDEYYHFFFTCNKYSNSIYKLMDNLLKLNDLVIIDTHLLLWGNSSLPADVNNTCIFWYVQT
jgi:hypothetical protein